MANKLVINVPILTEDQMSKLFLHSRKNRVNLQVARSSKREHATVYVDRDRWQLADFLSFVDAFREVVG